jgi:hypothetical protein
MRFKLMNKHTPGPWVKEGAFVAAATGKTICKTIGKCESTQSANARLIAAAPDLLDAVQAMVDAFGDQDSLLIDQCKAALAKATA